MHLFSSCWDDLEDPRTGNARLRDLLLIAPCTVLCGGQTATDITAFARAKETICAIFSRFPRVRPAMTPSRACSAGFDPVRFRAWLQRFTAAFGAQIRGGVEMGGKVLRRSYDKTSVTSAPHMVGARCCEADLMRAQIATDAKSNEIVAVPKLPQMLSLKGTLVTADALNCQRPAAAQIVEQGGDYAVPLRGNQPTLHAEVSLFLDDPATSPDDRHQSVEADHGRIETRTTTVSTEIGWLAETHKWPGLRRGRPIPLPVGKPPALAIGRGNEPGSGPKPGRTRRA